MIAASPIGDQIARHHASMVATLKDHTEALARARTPEAQQGALAQLVHYVDAELLPHAEAEEETLYARGRELVALAVLVASMTAEHRVLRRLRDALENPSLDADAHVLAAGAFAGVFEAHAAKENEFLVPGLIAAGVDVGALLGSMRELLAGRGSAG